MQCSCANNWSTTRLALEKGWNWKNASTDDRTLLNRFIETGGSGNISIDKFAREELLPHSDYRYANTFLLISPDGLLLGFISNAMGTVRIPDADLLGRNMGIIPRVPVLFLHRLGVLKQYHRKGIATLLVLRVFETLAHACTHSAAAAVALLVEPNNTEAKELYRSLLFERVESKDKDRDHELHILSYEAAISQIPLV